MIFSVPLEFSSVSGRGGGGRGFRGGGGYGGGYDQGPPETVSK